jgi:hypothetical protein
VIGDTVVIGNGRFTQAKKREEKPSKIFLLLLGHVVEAQCFPRTLPTSLSKLHFSPHRQITKLDVCEDISILKLNFFI